VLNGKTWFAMQEANSMSKEKSAMPERNESCRVSFEASTVSMFVAICIMALQPAVAGAGTLPPYQINAQAGSLFTTTPWVTVTDLAGGGYSSAYADLSPEVLVSGDGSGVNSSAGLKYQFEIVGPGAVVVVPIKIDGVALFGSTDAIANGGVFLGSFNDPRTYTYIYQFRCANSLSVQSCPQQGGFHLSEQVFSSEQGLNGNIYTIGLQAGGAVVGAARGNYFSQVDPTITIDPSFPDAGLYFIDISSGIGTGPAAVPEPATFLLLGAGMLALGRKVWRRKQR
jgi:hypothetical protein